MQRNQLTDMEFQGAISKVQTAFEALGLSTLQKSTTLKRN